MLARLTDTDGDEVWINPIHVRCVQPSRGMLGGNKGTQIRLSGDAVNGHKVYVKESPSAAAARLNETMPSLIDLSAIDRDELPHPPPPPPHTT